MVTVNYIDNATVPGVLSYVVVAVRSGGGWLFVKHRERGGYEMPAGHPEPGESSEEAAIRELAEETGAIKFTLEPVCYYSVEGHSGTKYGRLFYATVDTLGDIADADEIEGVRIFRKLPRNLSLPEVMTALFRRAEEHLRYIQR
ncbi:MAG: NUDIX domain-containing protein [Bacteroidales bacterium]|nr:NUDIX domain-containing protein [Bacteroidales bacterium]